jgi:hypothetical protein
MGNYLNNGQPKTNKTTGFKINFLTEVWMDVHALADCALASFASIAVVLKLILRDPQMFHNFVVALN